MTARRVYGEEVYNAAIQLLKRRGVALEEIGRIVQFLQSPYVPNLTLKQCTDSIHAVLQKREVQNALITGIQLDMLAEQGQLTSPLQEMVAEDESLYGVDEVMALAIVNIYGSIGFTNYGYVDKLKHGVLTRLNDKRHGVHTFLDDLVGAIAAAASSRIAHRHRREEEARWKEAESPFPEL